MTWDEWRFSAKLAWQDGFVRWVFMVSTLVVISMSIFLLWRVIPEGLRSGVIAMHYSIYLGIDDVRSWPWILLFPAVMSMVLFVNTIFALGVYRMHAIASRSLIAFSALTSVLWGIGIFFIVRINI